MEVGMAGPCNFVGTSKALPQHFIYGKGRTPGGIPYNTLGFF